MGNTDQSRSEKNTNWEGAYRVPCLVRWPGHIKAGSVSNDIVAHLDWLPTFAAMAGALNVKEELKAGTTIDGKPYKVYIDGICQLDHITGKGPSKREGFLYRTDDGELSGLRVDNWKFVFMEQRMAGTCMIWAEPLTTLRLPKIFNLRTDPYEHADITSNSYWDWMFDHVYLLVPAQILVGQVLSTFAEFPPRPKAASFNLSGVLEKMHQGATGGA